MKSIKERADEYIGHSFDADEPLSITNKRNGFLDGAKSEREELTRWHNSNEELPDKYKLVIIKYTRVTGYIYYAVAYICRLNEFNGERTVWRVSDADYHIKLSSVIGWREIHK